MQFLAFVFFFSFTQCAVVKRDADPDNLGLGYGSGIVRGGVTGVSPAQVSQPVCKSVPEKVCKDRSVETPRKVCHTEHDEIIDTTITEHCEERVTTKCEQVSSQTRHSQAIVGSDSKVVATGIVASGEATVAVGPSTATGTVAGYAAGGAIATGGIVSTGGLAVGSGYADGYGYSGVASTYSGYAKRDADADADAGFAAGIVAANTGVSPVSTSAPICRSVPVRHCNQVPVNRPRKVAKTVCKTVVDIKIIKDCIDTISTTCSQQSVQQSHSSAVVGTNSRDGPYAVVAEHGTVSVGASTTPIGAAPIGGYTSGSILGGSTIIGGGATIGATAPIAGGYIAGATGGLATAPIVNSLSVSATAPIAAAAPVAASAPVAAAPAPAAYSGSSEALAKAGLVSHPNGAVVPVEPAAVAAARAEHLAAVAEA